MRKGKLFAIIIAAVTGVLSVASAIVSATEQIPRMTKEELKGHLGNPDVVIIDVRVRGSWKGSEYKIKGAVREDPTDVNSWLAKYPKGKTLVFYCS